jgi:hypothetical protein
MVAEEAALREAGEKPEKGKQNDASAVPFALQVELFACQLAVALNDAVRLDGCIEALAALGAPRQALVPFEWARLRVKGASAEEMTALLADAKRVGVPETALTALKESAGNSAPQVNRAAKYKAPLDLAVDPSAKTAAPLVGTDDATQPAASEATVPSAIEGWVAGVAGLMGLGALGWWLRQRGLRRGNAPQPATSNSGV